MLLLLLLIYYYYYSSCSFLFRGQNMCLVWWQLLVYNYGLLRGREGRSGCPTSPLDPQWWETYSPTSWSSVLAWALSPHLIVAHHWRWIEICMIRTPVMGIRTPTQSISCTYVKLQQFYVITVRIVQQYSIVHALTWLLAKIIHYQCVPPFKQLFPLDKEEEWEVLCKMGQIKQ